MQIERVLEKIESSNIQENFGNSYSYASICTWL